MISGRKYCLTSVETVGSHARGTGTKLLLGDQMVNNQAELTSAGRVFWLVPAFPPVGRNSQ